MKNPSKIEIVLHDPYSNALWKVCGWPRLKSALRPGGKC